MARGHNKNSNLKLEVRRFPNDQQGGPFVGTYRFDVVLMRWYVWSSCWEDKVLTTFNQRAYRTRAIIIDYDAMRRDAIIYAREVAALIGSTDPTYHIMTEDQSVTTYHKGNAVPIDNDMCTPEGDNIRAEGAYPFPSDPIDESAEKKAFDEIIEKRAADTTEKKTLDLYRELVASISAADAAVWDRDEKWRKWIDEPMVGTVSPDDRHSGFQQRETTAAEDLAAAKAAILRHNTTRLAAEIEAESNSNPVDGEYSMPEAEWTDFNAAIMQHDIAVKIRDERLNSPPGHPFDEGDKIQ